MIFGKDRDQLLRRAVPQVTKRELLRIASLRRRITVAPLDLEAVDGRVIDAAKVTFQVRCPRRRRGAIERTRMLQLLRSKVGW